MIYVKTDMDAACYPRRSIIAATRSYHAVMDYARAGRVDFRWPVCLYRTFAADGAVVALDCGRCRLNVISSG